MSYQWSFGSDVLVLPAMVAELAPRAKLNDLRFLLALAADKSCRTDLDTAICEVGKKLSLSRAQLEASLAFWRGAGVLLEGEAPSPAPNNEKPPAAAPSPAGKLLPDRGIPSYSSVELAGVLERRSDLAALINSCQDAFGKIFNQSEIGIIVGMVDFLGFDGDYVLLLLSHCARMGKRSLRYAEKLALSLHDDGVVDSAMLSERLHRMESFAELEWKVRKIFGISSRALTTKEKNMIENWLFVLKYGEDIITKAYEITVDNTNEASVAYANVILERWNAAGYRTLADVEKALAEYRQKKNAIKGSSFDADEFFEAALKRGYGGT